MKLTETNIRFLIKEVLLSEELTKSDKTSIEKLVKKNTRALFSSDFSKMFDKEVTRRNSKLAKKVEDSVDSKIKNLKDDKNFEDVVIKIAKRVLQSIYTMHYNRRNLIKTMPIDKS
jgi:hypothetical protein